MREGLRLTAVVLVSGLLLTLLPALGTAQEHAAPAGPRAALVAAKAAQNRLLDIAVAGSHLVAVGEQGVILLSDDGHAWRQVPSPVDGMLTRLRFIDASQGWAVGYNAAILKTSDGGQSWQVQHFDAESRALFDLLFLDAQHGLAVGAYGSLLETMDGGAHWLPRESPLSQLGMHLNALQRLPDGSLFVVGERGLMARSVDDGANWQLLDSPYAGSLFGLLSTGGKGVVVYGMRGNVYSAADVSACAVMDIAKWDPYARETLTSAEALAQRGWRRLENESRESLFGAGWLGRDQAVLVGVNGTALRLDLAAETLVRFPARATETLSRAVVFQGHVQAVGRRGIQDLGPANPGAVP